ncbi:phage tail tube protein [Chelatococcus reniformis]|uniref:Phage tail protein n=1 Tax=Chelatococcus reniformis TaxID=1494448 RepID=A0A916UD24_9HYPH|nr:phage tail tube protein [Chelatococcus reniformis]GGC68562.1 phage tail protein [Chelatococcus reniformis]
MSNRFAGVANVTVDGDPIAVRGNLTVHAAKRVRTGIAGQDGVHGFSEMPQVPAIEMDVSTLEGFSAEAIDVLEDGTIIAEAANGTVWTLRDAWKAGTTEINTAEGMVRIRFEGMDIQEFTI